jgi:bifunctional non-homologous end joining protein LigD
MFAAKELRPMLATLPASPPSLTDKTCVYEPKVDGIRAIVEVLPGPPAPAVRFWSRNGNEKTAQFPDIAGAIAAWLKKITAPIVLDGEIVALDAEMRPASFQRLQHRIHVTVPGFHSRKPILSPHEQPAAFVAFDLLRHGDQDLRGLPLLDRRRQLEALFKTHKPPASKLVRLTPQVLGDGTALMQQAEKEQWEGLMVKRARSPYRTAKRSPEWMKYKLTRQDEFVVVGWTAPGGTRLHFGSLILGARDSQGLRYAGEVGTGFKGAELERLMKMLKRLETPSCPLNPKPKMLSAKGTPHWVRPQLVAQVRYTEITDDGRLRHPAYLGLRDDKVSSDVNFPAGQRPPKGVESPERTPPAAGLDDSTRSSTG